MDPAFLDAVRRGDALDVKGRIEQGAAIDAFDRYGQTALMLAAHAGHRDVVETLIAHHAKLDVAAKFGLTALMLALVGGHEEVARLLVNAGADLAPKGSGVPGFAGKSAFDMALERGMTDLLAILMPKA